MVEVHDRSSRRKLQSTKYKAQSTKLKEQNTCSSHASSAPLLPQSRTNHYTVANYSSCKHSTGTCNRRVSRWLQSTRSEPVSANWCSGVAAKKRVFRSNGKTLPRIAPSLALSTQSHT